jgi:hypothetical protein
MYGCPHVSVESIYMGSYDGFKLFVCTVARNELSVPAYNMLHPTL